MLHALDDVVANLIDPETGLQSRFDPVHYSADELDECLSDYEVVRAIGRGGMGAMVFLAQQPPLDRNVAIKVLPDELAVDPQTRSRFEREARALAKLDHPHIVSIHQSGTTPEGHLFIAMEYVEGTTLEHLLADRGCLGLDECLELMLPVCEAVAHAHERGIFHRDLKPSNILLDLESSSKVADFGLAKFLRPEERKSLYTLTQAGTLVGTMGYMAPEQLEVESPVDHRADIYSLGVILYRCLTGVLPTGRFPPPSQQSGTDEWIDGIILKALENSADDRYQSMQELHDAIAAKTPPPEAKKRRPWGVFASLGAAALAIVLFAISSNRRQPPPDDPVAVAPTLAPPSYGYQIALPAWSGAENAERRQIESQIPLITAQADAFVGRIRERVQLPIELEGSLYALVASHSAPANADLMLIRNGETVALPDTSQPGQRFADRVSQVLPTPDTATHFWASYAPVMAMDLYEALQAPATIEDATRSIAERVGLQSEQLLDILARWAEAEQAPPESNARDWALTQFVTSNYSSEAAILVRAVQLCPQLPSNNWDDSFAIWTDGALANRSMGRELESLACWNQAVLLATREKANAEWVEATAESSHVFGLIREYRKSLDAARAAMNRLETIGDPPMKLRALCQRVLGEALSRNANFEEAESLLRPALQRATANDDHDSKVTLHLQLALARHSARAGNYKEAEQLLSAAMDAIKVGSSGSMPTRKYTIAHCKQILGSVLTSMGRKKEAVVELESALEMERELIGERHLAYATCLTELALAQPGTHQAFNNLAEAITILRALHGETHPHTAEIVALGAMSEYRLKPDTQAEAALDTISKSLEVIKKFHGPDHPNVAVLLSNQIQILGGQDRHDEAQPLAKEAVRIFTMRYGADHPKLAADLANLAMTLSDPQELREVTDRLAAAARKFAAEYGDSHPTYGVALNALGSSLHELKNNNEAKTHLERAVAIARMHTSPSDIHLPGYLKNLGDVFRDDGDHLEAVECYTEAASLLEEANYAYEAVGALNTAAKILRDSGDIPKSAEYCEKALDMAESSSSLPASVHLGIRINLAYNLIALRRTDEARDQFQIVYDANSTEEAPLQYARAAYGLARHYRALKDYETAVPFYQTALAYFAEEDGEMKNHVRGSYDLASSLRHLERHAEAADLYRSLLAIEGFENGDPVLVAFTHYGLGIALRKTDLAESVVQATTSLEVAFAHQRATGKPMSNFHFLETAFKETLEARGDDSQSIEETIASLQGHGAEIRSAPRAERN